MKTSGFKKSFVFRAAAWLLVLFLLDFQCFSTIPVQVSFLIHNPLYAEEPLQNYLDRYKPTVPVDLTETSATENPAQPENQPPQDDIGFLKDQNSIQPVQPPDDQPDAQALKQNNENNTASNSAVSNQTSQETKPQETQPDSQTQNFIPGLSTLPGSPQVLFYEAYPENQDNDYTYISDSEIYWHYDVDTPNSWAVLNFVWGKYTPVNFEQLFGNKLSLELALSYMVGSSNQIPLLIKLVDSDSREAWFDIRSLSAVYKTFDLPDRKSHV